MVVSPQYAEGLVFKLTVYLLHSVPEVINNSHVEMLSCSNVTFLECFLFVSEIQRRIFKLVECV